MSENKQKKKMSKGNKIILGAFLTLVLAIVGIAGAIFVYGNSFLAKIEKVKVNEDELGIDNELDEKLISEYGDIQNIALFGIDSGMDERSRSDSMMILTINRKTKALKVTSIMRDTYVSIPNKSGKDKITHAYAFGGPELAMRTLNENFNLNIRDFITVNFESLPKIVDLIGGVEIDVDSSEIKYINNYINSVNKINGTNSKHITTPGTYVLDGSQALAYCRIRYTEGGDYMRTERHREVLEAIFENVQKINPSEFPSMLDEVLPTVKTSLPSKDIINIGMDILKIGGTLEKDRFPRDGFCKDETINGVSYITFDEEETKNQIHEWIFE